MEGRWRIFVKCFTHVGSPRTTVTLVPLLLAAFVPYSPSIALPEAMFPVAKRMNIETCLVRFDVHFNTIIRTEESRSMGACFLDDADLNAREQCLRLCCETENCDVFVFEEKSPGTCFLFQCGPPENFRCKFTHHSNYTSAVMSMPPVEQQQPPVSLVSPLASQIQSLSAQQQSVGGKKHLSQHEMELVNLKENGGVSSNSKQQPSVKVNFGTTSTTSLPPLGVRLGETLPTPSVSTPKQQRPLSQCGHFEFSCHSGECIGVYNVCDGIPQCEDGSDEGPDCPQKNSGPIGAGGPLNQPIEMIPPGDRNGLGGNNQPIRIGASSGTSKVMIPIYQPLDYQQQSPSRYGSIDLEQMQLQQSQQQQVAKPILMHRNREDPMTAPNPWPRPAINELNYVDSSDSHIFSHKGGLQLSAANNMMSVPSQQFQDSLPESSYMPSSTVVRGSVGGQSSYLSLPGGGSYSQQMPPQLSPEQQQPAYKPVDSQQQWMGGNPISHPNWSLKTPTDHLAGAVLPSPREQYIQPPVQQRRPAPIVQVQMPQSSSNGGSVSLPSVPLQQKPLLTQTLPASGQQWPVDGQPQMQEAPIPAAPSAPSSQGSDNRVSIGTSLTKDAGKDVASADQSSPPVVASAGQSPNTAKHKSTAPQGAVHDGNAEYDEDAYEDSYPESTNAGGETASDVEEPTQTEPPKKKLRKHQHKHDHGDGKSSNPATINEQTVEEKQKKKKKTKTTKKDKALDHHHGAPDEMLVHEHLEQAIHKDVEIEFIDHDGYADRPGGAMLSLMLGVLLTAAMGILLSCRMRVARRRTRKVGKSSYAHDADFLVNGMYL